MNFRDELARIIASDPRYSIEAYAFILEALDHARHQKFKAKGRDRDNEPSSQPGPRDPARRPNVEETARFGPCHRSRALRSGPKIGPAPVRIAGGNRARSLGRPVDVRYRRNRLQPDRRRRPGKDARAIRAPTSTTSSISKRRSNPRSCWRATTPFRKHDNQARRRKHPGTSRTSIRRPEETESVIETENS